LDAATGLGGKHNNYITKSGLRQQGSQPQVLVYARHFARSRSIPSPGTGDRQQADRQTKPFVRAWYILILLTTHNNLIIHTAELGRKRRSRERAEETATAGIKFLSPLFRYQFSSVKSMIDDNLYSW
jgi:hypothetical protein